MRFVLGCFACLVLCLNLSACKELQARFEGYPSQDTAINLHTATAQQLADALSQMARFSTLGTQWHFPNPHDVCTVQITDKTGKQRHLLDLRHTQVTLQRDAHTQRYYTGLQRATEHPTAQPPHQLLRLFEGAAYHDMFFAEGYLRALTLHCERSRHLQAHSGAAHSM